MDRKMISEILFDIDPMNTCCKENHAYDEYDRIADQIENLPELTPENIRKIFFDSFNVRLTEDSVKEIISHIS